MTETPANESQRFYCESCERRVTGAYENPTWDVLPVLQSVAVVMLVAFTAPLFPIWLLLYIVIANLRGRLLCPYCKGEKDPSRFGE
jgi:hypothetical protein